MNTGSTSSWIVSQKGMNITLKIVTSSPNSFPQVGIHVTMNNLSMTEFDNKVVYERNTSMYLIGWGTISVDGGWPYDLFIRSIGEHLGSLNSGHYSNAEVDRLGIAASQEMNPRNDYDYYRKDSGLHWLMMSWSFHCSPRNCLS